MEQRMTSGIIWGFSLLILLGVVCIVYGNKKNRDPYILSTIVTIIVTIWAFVGMYIGW